MAACQALLSLLLLLFCLLSVAVCQSIIRIPTDRKTRTGDDDDLYCDSWRLSVETNNAGYWTKIPSRCQRFVQQYMTGDRYLSDSEIVASDSLTFTQTLNIHGDGKDAWIFDIDETLLSNLPYYELHGFGSEPFDEVSFDKWVELAEASAIPASLNFYKELKQLGFTIFLLTGRSEYQRNSTVKNLLFAGYSNWERLILRSRQASYSLQISKEIGVGK